MITSSSIREMAAAFSSSGTRLLPIFCGTVRGLPVVLSLTMSWTIGDVSFESSHFSIPALS